MKTGIRSIIRMHGSLRRHDVNTNKKAEGSGTNRSFPLFFDMLHPQSDDTEQMQEAVSNLEYEPAGQAAEEIEQNVIYIEGAKKAQYLRELDKEDDQQRSEAERLEMPLLCAVKRKKDTCRNKNQDIAYHLIHDLIPERELRRFTQKRTD